jgi:hypothetical protein
LVDTTASNRLSRLILLLADPEPYSVASFTTVSSSASVAAASRERLRGRECDKLESIIDAATVMLESRELVVVDAEEPREMLAARILRPLILAQVPYRTRRFIGDRLSMNSLSTVAWQ